MSERIKLLLVDDEEAYVDVLANRLMNARPLQAVKSTDTFADGISPTPISSFHNTLKY